MYTWRKYNGALIPNAPPHVLVDLTNIERKIEEELYSTERQKVKKLTVA